MSFSSFFAERRQQESGKLGGQTTSDTAAGEAAFQIVELILMALIDRGIIDRDALVGQIEDLAAETADIAPPAPPKTVRGRLSDLANSLRAQD